MLVPGIAAPQEKCRFRTGCIHRLSSRIAQASPSIITQLLLHGARRIGDMGDATQIIATNIVNSPDTILLYVNYWRRIVIAGQIKAAFTVVGLVTATYIIGVVLRSAVISQLHLGAITRSIVGKGGHITIFGNGSRSLKGRVSHILCPRRYLVTGQCHTCQGIWLIALRITHGADAAHGGNIPLDVISSGFASIGS